MEILSLSRTLFWHKFRESINKELISRKKVRLPLFRLKIDVTYFFLFRFVDFLCEISFVDFTEFF